MSTRPHDRTRPVVGSVDEVGDDADPGADPVALADEVRRVGLDAGLDAVGATTAAPFPAVRDVLERRRAAGLHGGMQLTYRNPARSTDPTRSFPAARSLVVGARRYASRGQQTPPPPSDAAAHARVARYAVHDHYADLRAGLQAVAAHLRAAGWRAWVVADDNALVDRAAAHRAGLGWYGKSSNLLLPGEGSWFVLGSVVTDAVVAPTGAVVPDGCGSCERCLDGCPTGAIVAPGVVDARRCLAWLLQADGVFPVEHRAALGDRIYGCDDCQEVCPPNRRAVDDDTVAAPPGASRRGGPLGPWLDVLSLLARSDDDLLALVGRWYVPRRDPQHLRRNLLVVLGNVGRADDPATAEALRTHLADPRPLVRAHAVWAARRLGRADLLDERRGRPGGADDPEPIVAAEHARPVVPPP